MSAPNITHWAEQYRDRPNDSLEYKIFMAACYCAGDEAHVRAVGIYAFEHNCAIWHAAWELSTKQYPCMCAPCQAGTTKRDPK